MAGIRITLNDCRLLHRNKVNAASTGELLVGLRLLMLRAANSWCSHRKNKRGREGPFVSRCQRSLLLAFDAPQI